MDFAIRILDRELGAVKQSFETYCREQSYEKYMKNNSDPVYEKMKSDMQELESALRILYEFNVKELSGSGI